MKCVWSLTPLIDGVDSKSWSDNKDEDVGGKICKNLKITHDIRKLTPYANLAPCNGDLPMAERSSPLRTEFSPCPVMAGFVL